MKLLMTGFEPFNGREVNASQRAVQAVSEQRFPGVDLATAILPVDRERGPAALFDAFHAAQPDVVLCLGEARGRMRISIERVAVNLLDFALPDNGGRQVCDEPIVAGGPAAYFATLPVRALLDTLRQAGIPAELSLTAGAFLCNQVAYTLLHAIAQERIPCRAGFIHLPLLPERAAVEPIAVPSMSLDTMQRALALVVQALSGRVEQTHI